MGLQVGDKVYYGKPSGEQTLGEVVKVNRVSVKVKQLEERAGTGGKRYPIGTVWSVPVSLCVPAFDKDGNLVPNPTAYHKSSSFLSPPLFRKGDEIQFNGKGGVLLKGLVTRVNTKSYSVVVPGDPLGWTVPFHLAQAAMPVSLLETQSV